MSCKIEAALFGPQCLHWIDAQGAADRPEAGADGRKQKDQRDDGQNFRVACVAVCPSIDCVA
jgi:hypothetical protein